MRLAGMLLATAVLSIGLATSAQALVVADGKVYWIKEPANSDSKNRTAGIGRANVDGTKVERSLVRGFRPADIAVNDRHVYWTSGEPGKAAEIGRARLDGKRVQRRMLRVRAGSIDVHGRYVYWGGRRTIGRAKLNGKAARSSFIRLPGRDWTVADVAVDGGHVFWSEGMASERAWENAREQRDPTGRLGRADLNGKGVVREWATWHRSALMTSSAEIVGLDRATIYWRTAHPDNMLEYAFAGSPESPGACQPVLNNCKALIALLEEGFNPNAQFTVADGYVYWADPVRRGTRIYRSALTPEGGSAGITVGSVQRGRRELVVALRDRVV